MNNPHIFGQLGSGQTSTTTSGPIFGQTSSTFGQTATTASGNVFGQTATTLSGCTFGQTATTTSGSTFGQTATTTSGSIFGQTATAASGSIFGQTTPSFASSSTFGQTTGHSIFNPSAQTTVAAIFSQTATTSSSGSTFGQTRPVSGPIFGQTTVTASGSIFGQAATTTSGSTFGQTSTTTSGSIFGQTASGPIFGQTATTTSGSTFGQTSTTTSGPIFGQTATTTSGSTFGQTSTTTSGSIFGQTASVPIFGQTASGSIFGRTATTSTGGTTSSGSTFGQTAIFGKTATTPSGSTFGQTATTTSGSTFGQITPAGGPIFGQTTATASSSIFGQTATTSSGTSAPPSSSIFGQGTSGSTSVFGQTAAVSGATAAVGKSQSGQTFTHAVRSSADKDTGRLASNEAEQPAKKTLHALLTEDDKEDQSTQPQHHSHGQEEELAVGHRKLRRPAPRGRGTSQKSRGLFGKAVSGISKQVEPTTSAEAQEDSTPSTSGIRTARKGLPVTPRSTRRSTADEMASKVAIVCKNIPDKLVNDRTALKKHFSKFGNITRFYVTPQKASATIHYDTHQEAENAKKKGGSIRRGLPRAQIFWSSHNPSLARNKDGDTQKDEARTLGKAREVKKIVSSEIAAELEGMSGTSDITDDEQQALYRPAESLRGRSRGREPSTVKSRPRAVSPVGGRDRQSRPVSPAIGRDAHSRPVSPTSSSAGSTHIEKAVSLDALSRLRGQSSSERCEILSQRDKILRQARAESKVHGDLATVQAIRGTCCDMCPERERYLREDRRRLHVYEIIPGTDQARQNPHVDHTRAVKEYSRSSADQDMPLSNELRPPAVLDMTMNYLLHHIMDRGQDGRWADWFDFVWNRTRSIRKDITQQHLCDEISAQLTEKCARFHIYCSERLCEEDMMTFDAKINDENLTKCLQTLKELYHDLEEKQQLTCTNEAEFRAYIILMNLNEGDVLRETQQLREAVRESEAVKFAVSVYSALNSNNYMRFFKLVRRAPFLSACILHRYFTQVRQMALLTMLKAYGPVRTYPLSELARRLAFETEEEASEFCQHYGLRVTEGQVSMDRGSFVRPEAAFPQARAVTLIEGKLTASVGEVVNGSPLEPFILHQPSTSFDSAGHFRIGQETPVVVPPSASLQPQLVAPPTEPAPESRVQTTAPMAYTREVNDAVKDIAKELFVEVIGEFCHSLSTSLAQFAQLCLSTATSVSEQVIEVDTTAFLREIATEAHAEMSLEVAEVRQKEARQREARQKAELLAMKDQAAQDIISDITGGVIDEFCGQLALQQYREVQTELRRESLQRVTHDLLEDVLDSVVSEEVENTAQEVYTVDVETRLKVLELTGQAVQQMVLLRFFKQWKNQYAGRMRLRRSMQTFPPAPSMESLQNQFEALLPDSVGVSQNGLHMGHSASVTLAGPAQTEQQGQTVRHQLSLHLYVRRLKQQISCSPLDLPAIVGTRLLRRSHSRHHHSQDKLLWKLVVSLSEEVSHPFLEWLKSKFTRGSVPNTADSSKSAILSLYSAPLSVTQGHRPVSVGVCVRTVTDVLTDADIQQFEGKHCMLGTSGLLFVITPLDEGDEDDEETFWLEQRLRLSRVLQSKPVYPPLPLVVVCSSQMILARRHLQLEKFVVEGLLSHYEVVFIPEDLQELSATQKMIKAVNWLAEKCPQQPQLTSCPLQDFVDDVLSQHYFTAVYHDLACRKKNNLLDQSPGTLVQLYNSVVEHMVTVATGPELAKLSWPVSEFCAHWEDLPAANWNYTQQLTYLQDNLLTFALPQFDHIHSESEEWEDACKDVWYYVTAVGEEATSTAALFSKVRWLLSRSKRDFEEQCLNCLQLDNCLPRYVNMPWTDILTACIEYKLSLLQWKDPRSQYEDGQELLVHYFPRTLEQFSPPPTWLEATKEDVHKDAANLTDTVARSGKRKHQECAQKTSQKQSRVEAIPETFSAVSHVKTAAYSVAQNLNNSIASEKKKLREYESFLEKAVGAGNDFLDVTCDSNVTFTEVTGLNCTDRTLSAPIFTQPLATTDSSRPEVNDSTPLAEGLDKLSAYIQSSRKADQLFEMKLQSFLTESL